MTDPVLWARAFIQFYNPITKQNEPWIARWYQAEMMRDTSQFKAYLNGRRTGKCLPGWVRIPDPITGEYYKIKDLYKRKNANVITMHEDTGQLAIQTNCPVLFNGSKPVYRVTLANGQFIDATGNHPLYTLNGWKEIYDLKIDDIVAVVPGLNLDTIKCPSALQIEWTFVESINFVGIYDTYDLTVPETHNFVAENIIVHNTEVMCVEGMYKAATNKNIVVLYATPYESQIRLIFNRLTELYTGSPLLKDTVVSNTKNPFAIKLNNGSRIVGFTTGAKTGSGAASLRGQRADQGIIYSIYLMFLRGQSYVILLV